MERITPISPRTDRTDELEKRLINASCAKEGPLYSASLRDVRKPVFYAITCAPQPESPVPALAALHLTRHRS